MEIVKFLCEANEQEEEDVDDDEDDIASVIRKVIAG
jgi:hypothetical protein